MDVTLLHMIINDPKVLGLHGLWIATSAHGAEKGTPRRAAPATSFWKPLCTQRLRQKWLC